MKRIKQITVTTIFFLLGGVLLGLVGSRIVADFWRSELPRELGLRNDRARAVQVHSRPLDMPSRKH